MNTYWSRITVLKKLHLENIQKTTIFLLVIALFVVVNVIVGYVPIRFDFSEGRAHTLSPATRTIIHTLDDVVTLKFFISSDLPARLLSLKTDAVDLVNEYKKAGRGKIIVKVLDPKKDSQAIEEAKNAGVPELQFSQIEKDKYAVLNTYFGIFLQYGTKKDIIPQATDLSSLEYDITSAIFKLTSKNPIKIGIIGASEFVLPQQDSLYTAKKILQQQFDLNFIDASSSAKTVGLDKSLQTVVIFDEGQILYGSDEASMLSAYVQNHGKIIAFVDGISVSEEQFMPYPVSHNLFSFFESYGMTLNKDFVLSESSEMASFSNGLNIFVTPYPFWIKTSRLDEKSSELSHMKSLLFPWTSSVDIKKKTDIETRVLVRSETQSWNQKEGRAISPQSIQPPEKNAFKSFNLIIEAKEKKGGVVLLIPSSRFLNEQYITRSPENVGLFINFINNYASGGALSGIRTRARSTAPIHEVSDQNKDIVKYMTILLLPGLFGLFGAFRLIRRK